MSKETVVLHGLVSETPKFVFINLIHLDEVNPLNVSF